MSPLSLFPSWEPSDPYIFASWGYVEMPEPAASSLPTTCSPCLPPPQLLQRHPSVSLLPTAPALVKPVSSLSCSLTSPCYRGELEGSDVVPYSRTNTLGGPPSPVQGLQDTPPSLACCRRPWTEALQKWLVSEFRSDCAAISGWAAGSWVPPPLNTSHSHSPPSPALDSGSVSALCSFPAAHPAQCPTCI